MAVQRYSVDQKGISFCSLGGGYVGDAKNMLLENGAEVDPVDSGSDCDYSQEDLQPEQMN